jgi:hypothetical protein
VTHRTDEDEADFHSMFKTPPPLEDDDDVFDQYDYGALSKPVERSPVRFDSGAMMMLLLCCCSRSSLTTTTNFVLRE